MFSLQSLIEAAWRKGFDVQGSEQLGGKLVNTRKWIGATEIVAFFTANRIKTELLDFHTPTTKDGTHPKLFQWVLDYFRERARAKAFTPPLYLQHQGHSRTIVGFEVLASTSHRFVKLVLNILFRMIFPSMLSVYVDKDKTTDIVYMRLSDSIT